MTGRMAGRSGPRCVRGQCGVVVAATDLALPQRDTTRQIMTLVAELVVDHHLAFVVVQTAWRRVRVRSSKVSEQRR